MEKSRNYVLYIYSASLIHSLKGNLAKNVITGSKFAHTCFAIFFCRCQKDWKINQLIHCNDRFVKGLIHLFPSSFLHFLGGGKRKLILASLKITFFKVLTTYLATNLYLLISINKYFFQFI